MGHKAAAAQALQKADSLKAKVVAKSDLVSDLQAWTDLQQLQTAYHQVLIVDLEYALDKKVEQELWTFGFKNYISILQAQARDKKNPRRSDIHSLLSWCLESASGFYITLLQELCTNYDLNFSFLKRGNVLGQISRNTEVDVPQSSSCIYMCQYCLVHLGDLARYRNQRKQAESFYKHAVLLSPTSGQPYNQLALLETGRGNKLAAIFYYVQGIAVKNPFPATYTNLMNTFASCIDKDYTNSDVQTKMSMNDFVTMFIKVHGFLHTVMVMDQADVCVKSLNATLTPLVATESFSAQKLIQMTIINLYTFNHVAGTNELTDDERKVRTFILELIAGSLSAFLLPVYTLNQDISILDYCALPAIKLIANWIQSKPEVLQETVFTDRLQIWPSLCKLLNTLQTNLEHFDYGRYEKMPLKEDRELQGFLPLKESFEMLDFKSGRYQGCDKNENLVRAKRLVDFGSWIAARYINNLKLIVVKKNGDKTEFEPACVQPDPTTQLLEEMKSFSVSTVNVKAPEKRSGILKPQGSLEKARGERELVLLSSEDGNSSLSNQNRPSGLTSPSGNHLNKTEQTKLKRASQNVALQSIFKKIEENKQVKFDVGLVEKDKSNKFDTKPSVIKQQSNQPPKGVQYVPSLPPAPDYFRNYPMPPAKNIDRPAMQPLQFPSMDGSKTANQFPQPLNFPHGNLYSGSQNLSDFSSNLPAPAVNQQPVQFPSYNQFKPSREMNAWQTDERLPQNWWPNTNQPVNMNYQRDYPLNLYSNQYSAMNMDFNKPDNSQLNSPWSASTSLPNKPAMGFEPSNQGLSLRQAMLKETKPFSAAISTSNTPNYMNKPPDVQNSSNAPGYSLFSSSSWAPNLAGQFRNPNSSGDGLSSMQHSMFPTQAPLQQLLDQQNQLKKGNS